VYSTLFPSHVRRIVMDGNVDPRHVWNDANLAQDTAFQRNADLWFSWLAKYHRVYHLGATRSQVARTFYATQAALDRRPARGVVGGSEWNDVFLLAGYAQFLWTDLADTFAGWVHHRDVVPLLNWYTAVDTPGDDNGFAVYNAVTCTDAPFPSRHAYFAENRRVARVAPFATWNNAWFNGPCLAWEADAGTPVSVHGHGVKALLTSETLDGATPFSGSLEVRTLFPKASLIAVAGGTTHASSLTGNACVDNRIAAYLATGKLPPRKAGNRADVTCAAPPKPVPAQAMTTASASASPHASASAGTTSAADVRAALDRAHLAAGEVPGRPGAVVSR